MFTSECSPTPVAPRLSDETPQDRTWLRFMAFLVMGGFQIDNLPSHLHEPFREVQREVRIAFYGEDV